MFSKIDWYFSKKFLSASLLVGVFFYALFFLLGLLENADTELTLDKYLLGVGLGTFSFFYVFLPTILLMAFLFAFSSMVAKREIIILQALGLPFKSMVSMVLKGAFLVLFIWGVFMEYAFPLAVNQSKVILSQSENTKNISISGEWIRANDFFIKIISTEGEKVYGVTIYQLDEQRRLKNFYTASRGVWQETRLSLYDIEHTHYQYSEQKLPTGLEHTQLIKQTLSQKEFSINLTFDTFSYITLEPNQMYLSQLLNYADYLKENRIHGGGEGKFVFAFWERVLMPLSIIGLILIIMPTMLGTPRVQRLGDKIFIGIFIGLIYFIAMEFSRNSSVYTTIPNELAAAFLPLLLLCTGIFFCYRASYKAQ